MTFNTSAAKVALVTGAARRVGAEIAQTLHQAGFNIILHYNDSAEDANRLAVKLNADRADSVVLMQADLLKQGQETTLVQAAFDQWNRLDAVINNASRYFSTKVGETTEAMWDELFNSNVKAAFFLSQAAAPYLHDRQGSIVNITDIHAERPLKGYPIYSMAKSALVMMTKALARELGPDIRVNAVAPGAIIWPEGENSLSDDLKTKIIKASALKRTGTPHDIAKAVLFLIENTYITGQILAVDGGRSIVT